MLSQHTACEIKEAACDCNFDHLPFLLFVCHVILPLLTIPLTFVLIPNKRMTESLEVGEGGGKQG